MMMDLLKKQTIKTLQNYLLRKVVMIMSLDNFIPKSESDFLEYAELISHKLRPYEKSFHYIRLLEAVMRLSMTNLKAADAKEVASSSTAIANEKFKPEKEGCRCCCCWSRRCSFLSGSFIIIIFFWFVVTRLNLD